MSSDTSSDSDESDSEFDSLTNGLLNNDTAGRGFEISDGDFSPPVGSWEERQRRARSLRLFIMFLTMMLLMDDPEEHARQQKLRQQQLQGGGSTARKFALQQNRLREQLRLKELKELYGNQSLEEIDALLSSEIGLIRKTLVQHDRFIDLDKKNIELAQHTWSVLKMAKPESKKSSVEQMQRESESSTAIPDKGFQQTRHEIDEDSQQVTKPNVPLTTYYYYPSNATGYYRGSWSVSRYISDVDYTTFSTSSTELSVNQYFMMREKRSSEHLNLWVLPPGCQLRSAFASNITRAPSVDVRKNFTKASQEGESSTDKLGTNPSRSGFRAFVPDLSCTFTKDDAKSFKHASHLSSHSEHARHPSVSINAPKGRLALQLTMKKMPNVNSTVLRLVEGYIRLIDDDQSGFLVGTSYKENLQIASSYDISLKSNDDSKNVGDSLDPRDEPVESTSAKEEVEKQRNHPVRNEGKTRYTNANLRRVIGENHGVLHIAVKGVFIPSLGTMRLVGNTPEGRSALVIRKNQEPDVKSDLPVLERRFNVANKPSQQNDFVRHLNEKAGINVMHSVSGDSQPAIHTAELFSNFVASTTECLLSRLMIEWESLVDLIDPNRLWTEHYVYLDVDAQLPDVDSIWHVLHQDYSSEKFSFSSWDNLQKSSRSVKVNRQNPLKRNPWLSWMKLSKHRSLYQHYLGDNMSSNSVLSEIQKSLTQPESDVLDSPKISPLWLPQTSGTKSPGNSLTPCEFEIILDINPMLFIFVPGEEENSSDDLDGYRPPPKEHEQVRSGPKPEEEQELVSSLTGTLVSHNCQFSANLTARSQRVNWGSITNKAINYTFIMMLVSLSQIVLLLRQLIHSQSHSMASRVSMLSIGWMCMLDAHWFMVHILFCLVMQPLFTAFASVAFFKLLMFCVLEMKYMQIIYQARQASSGDNPTAERMRRQLAVIQARFYAGVTGTCLLYWILQKYWALIVVLLHSFWVPQIVRNAITEAKRPCHPHFLFGMSITRVLAPIYIFGVRDNFVREINPEFPESALICYALIMWVGLQTAVLYLQSKFGARFFVPARFLPPKFDYGRPIPSSLLQSRASSREANSSGDIELGSTGSANRSCRASGIRNRNGGTPSVHTTADNMVNTSEDESPNTLDCVICYSPIDPIDRRGYMLGPCDHIFHRRCLEQWMEVKMECPTCRSDLPPL